MKALTALPTQAYVQAGEEANIPLQDLLKLVQELETNVSPAYIARYRPDVAAGLSVERIQDIQNRLRGFLDLADRRVTILTAINQQGRLTPELREQIESSMDRRELEDLYLPFKPKRRTAADDAIEKGLDGLALFLWKQEGEDGVDAAAAEYVKGEGDAPEAALAGACDIIARWLGENAEIRRDVRKIAHAEAEIAVSALDPKRRLSGRDENQRKRFAAMDGYRAPVAKAPWRQVLSLRRGNREGWLELRIELPRDRALQYLEGRLVRDAESAFAPHLKSAAAKALDVYLAPAIEKELRQELDERCDAQALGVYKKNLRKLLLAPPAGPRTMIGLETNRSGGWRAAVIGPDGALLEAAIVREDPDAKPEANDEPADEAGAAEASRKDEQPRQEAGAETDEPAPEAQSESAEAASPEAGAERTQAETTAEPSASEEDAETAVAAADQGAQERADAGDRPAVEAEVKATPETSAMTAPKPDDDKPAEPEEGAQQGTLQFEAPAPEEPSDEAVEPTAATKQADESAAAEGSAPEAEPTPPEPQAEAQPAEQPVPEAAPEQAEPEATAAEAAEPVAEPTQAAPDAAPAEDSTPAAESKQAEPGPDAPVAGEAAVEAASEATAESEPAASDAAEAPAAAESASPAAPVAPAAAEGEGKREPKEAKAERKPRAKTKAEPVRKETPQGDLAELIARHQAELVVFGNGPGLRQVERVVRLAAKKSGQDCSWLATNEAGSWIYATSKTARKELPDYEPAVRSAACLARRVQDPMGELMKVDPRVLGIGQGHHEVDQRALRNALREAQEAAVQEVGVDVNAAPMELLALVPGMTERVARRIVEHRRQHGPFPSRAALSEMAGLNARVYEQAAGFLRVYGGENPLDATGLHPRDYSKLGQILQKAGVAVEQALDDPASLAEADLSELVDKEHSERALKAIVRELTPRVRKPRGEFSMPEPTIAVEPIDDPKAGMKVEGVITNVADFGIFVDIGAEQDGLVHISQLAAGVTREGEGAVKAGDRLTVYVVNVANEGKRISLSMREPREPRESSRQRRVSPEGRRAAESHRRGRDDRRRDRPPMRRTFGPDDRKEDEKLKNMSLDQKLNALQDKFRTKV